MLPLLPCLFVAIVVFPVHTMPWTYGNEDGALKVLAECVAYENKATRASSHCSLLTNESLSNYEVMFLNQ